MTYDQFEDELQDWLDQGRLDEAHQLLAHVRPADRSQCEALLATYQALFAGLAAGRHSPLPPAKPTLPSNASPVPPAGTSPLAILGLALAACLGLVLAAPLASTPSHPSVAHSDGVNSAGGELPPTGSSPEQEFTPQPAAEVARSESPPSLQERDITRLAASSLRPLASGVATRTDTALRSIGHWATRLNPLDEQLAAYREAAPLLGTLTRSLLPGTSSLGDAFSVLHQSTLPGTGHAESPAAPAPPVTSAERTVS